MATGRNVIPLSERAALEERLLAETAVRVELPPSWHQRAVERYEAIRSHIERPGSPLENRLELFYPQGSMAIRATIRTRKRDTGYDIDIVAELRLPPDTPPEKVLDLLYEAIKVERGSRYYDMVERQTRCITVHYADGMHLDVTPAILQDPADPRRSWIFHAKPGELSDQHRRLTMNSYAFADWFNGRTPVDADFAEAYGRRALARERGITLAEADAEPVPDHPHVEGGKSVTVVGLQLLKRHRNVRYASRRGARMPPSVAISCLAGHAATPGSRISDALEAISRTILGELEHAERAGRLIDLRNPCCEPDRFTDRWPENRAAQRRYIEDLHEFRAQLEQLMAEGSLEDKAKLLKAMFGEDPADSVIKDYARGLGASVASGSRHVGRSGRIVTGVAGAGAAGSPGAGRARGHTFHGGKLR